MKRFVLTTLNLLELNSRFIEYFAKEGVLKMSKYEYMVVYAFNQCLGRICITLNEKVECYQDVEKLDKIIEEHNGKNVIVIDFKLLRTFEDN